jgi:hypothetical protein
VHQALRSRLVALGAPDITVTDDGREIVFVLEPRLGPTSVLRWRIRDRELQRLTDGLTADAREAWGTSSADGLYLVANRIEELLRTWPGGEGRIEVEGHTLVAALPDDAPAG